MLSTRVVRRLALRLHGAALPLRQYDLALVVEPVTGVGAAGQAGGFGLDRDTLVLLTP